MSDQNWSADFFAQLDAERVAHAKTRAQAQVLIDVRIDEGNRCRSALESEKAAHAETKARAEKAEAQILYLQGPECPDHSCGDPDGEHPFHLSAAVTHWNNRQADLRDSIRQSYSHVFKERDALRERAEKAEGALAAEHPYETALDNYRIDYEKAQGENDALRASLAQAVEALEAVAVEGFDLPDHHKDDCSGGCEDHETAWLIDRALTDARRLLNPEEGKP